MLVDTKYKKDEESTGSTFQISVLVVCRLARHYAQGE